MFVKVQKPFKLVIKISTHYECGEGKSEKPFFICVLHFTKNKMQWYREEYYDLECIHSHMGTKASEYQNDQWYVHTNNMKKCAIIKCGKPRQVCTIIKKYNKWTRNKQNVGVVGRVHNQVITIGPV